MISIYLYYQGLWCEMWTMLLVLAYEELSSYFAVPPPSVKSSFFSLLPITSLFCFSKRVKPTYFWSQIPELNPP